MSNQKKTLLQKDEVGDYSNESKLVEGLHYYLCSRNFNENFDEEKNNTNFSAEMAAEQEDNNNIENEDGNEDDQNMTQEDRNKKDLKKIEQQLKLLNQKNKEQVENQLQLKKEEELKQKDGDELQKQQKSQQLAKIPLNFVDVDDYITTFESHLFNEAKAQIVKARVTDSNPPEKVELIGVDKIQNDQNFPNFWKFRLRRNESEKNTNIYMQHDFCIISQNNPNLQDVGEHLLGVLEKQEGNQIILKVVYDQKRQEQNGSKIKKRWFLQKMCRLVTMEREYEGLQKAGRQLKIMNKLLNPEKFISEQRNTEYFSIPDQLQKQLVKQYNESQLEAIQQTLKKSGITLIQGPPGTGKTTTVIGTVSVLMNSFNQTKKESNKIVQKGIMKEQSDDKNFKMDKAMPWMFSGYTDWRDEIFTEEEEQNEQKQQIQNKKSQQKQDILMPVLNKKLKKPGMFIKEKGAVVDKAIKTEEAPPEKILICGPSNASIDEIIRKIIEKQLLDGTGKIYDPSNVIVRIGENYDANLQAFSLDHQANMVMQEKNFKDDQKQEAKKIVLKRCKIICGTLSAAGSFLLQQNNLNFDTVIIDEAAQAVEPSILVPLQYGCQRLILIGDQKQLPATIFSKLCEKFNYSQSLFERMEKNKYPIHMLKVQYRMHPKISSFISNAFYENNLKDYAEINRLIGKPALYENNGFAPLLFFHVNGAEKFVDNSYKNDQESNCILEIFQYLKKTVGDKMDVYSDVGIITPYAKQVKDIRNKIKILEETNKCMVEVNSVDGYQGREKELVIFSTVRASKIAVQADTEDDKIIKNPKKTIGFLRDHRRMNVSLSRARIGLIVVGDINQLQGHAKWKMLIEQSIEQESCYKMSSPYSTFFNRFTQDPSQSRITDIKQVVDVKKPKKSQQKQ